MNLKIDSINYLGKTHKCKEPFQLATKQQINEFKEIVLGKPQLTKVKDEFIQIFNGKNNYTNIRQYFLNDIMFKCRINNCKWSIDEILNSDQIISFILHKLKKHSSYYGMCKTFKKAIFTCFRTGCFPIISIPSIYKIKDVKYILQKYNVNNTFYDFSCGWGARLLAAMSMNIQYLGTDPNYQLTEELDKIYKMFNQTNNTNRFVDIRTQGSEIYIPEWKNKVGLAFSSPPYFNAQSYRVGNQSYIEGKTTYDEWCQNYLFKTLKNIWQYLIEGGYFVINVKNIIANDRVDNSIRKNKIFKIEDYVIENAKKIGFKYIGNQILKVFKRLTFHDDTKMDQNILVFQKEKK